MSEGHTGPDDEDEGQIAPEETNAQAAAIAEQPAAAAPVEGAGEQAIAEKPAPKKRAPRKPKAVIEGAAPEKSVSEKPAPKRGQKMAEAPPPPPVEEEEKRSAFREPVVLWSIVGGAIVILAALGYVGWTQFGSHPAGGTAANALANRSVCEATLERAQAYGILSSAATLAQSDPDKTQVDGRVTCHAQADGGQYAMTVDVPCDDMSKETCIKLYSVKQADGTSLFQRQM